MTIAESIMENIPSQFSYGETLALIIENRGSLISNLPEEDYVFEDKSILRLTNTGCKLLQYLQE